MTTTTTIGRQQDDQEQGADGDEVAVPTRPHSDARLPSAQLAQGEVDVAQGE